MTLENQAKRLKESLEHLVLTMLDELHMDKICKIIDRAMRRVWNIKT